MAKQNLSISDETVQQIEWLQRETYRSKSNLIEWLVAEKVREMGGIALLPANTIAPISTPDPAEVPCNG
jgi:hypothetical protein